MSERDAAPDPMDKAYAEVEAMLDDEAARAARRARVLAAVAQETADPTAAVSPRPPAWRRGGWLAAACVAGLSALVALEVYPPVRWSPPSAPATTAQQTGPPAPAVIPPTQPPEPAASTVAAAPPAERRTPTAPAVAPPAARALESIPAPELPPRATATASAPAPPAPPPPATTVEESVVSAQRRTPDAAEGPRMAKPTRPRAAQSADDIQELVVTGSRIQADQATSDLAQRLLAAAAAGRARDVAALIARGAPVDAADDDGETALMKAVRGDHPATVALLRRKGADLDVKNQAGLSARDLARQVADPKLDKALGTSP